MLTRPESLAGLPDALELTFPGGLGSVAVGGTPQCLATWTPPSPHPQACFARPHDPDRLPPEQRQAWRSPYHFCSAEWGAHGSPAPWEGTTQGGESQGEDCWGLPRTPIRSSDLNRLFAFTVTTNTELPRDFPGQALHHRFALHLDRSAPVTLGIWFPPPKGQNDPSLCALQLLFLLPGGIFPR